MAKKWQNDGNKSIKNRVKIVMSSNASGWHHITVNFASIVLNFKSSYLKDKDLTKLFKRITFTGKCVR